MLIKKNIYPCFQKAQAEIDEVVGRSRLPCWDDKPDLPYFEALLAELTRRSNVAPLALFHCNNEEAQISGYKYDSCLYQNKNNIQNSLKFPLLLISKGQTTAAEVHLDIVTISPMKMRSL